MSLYRALRTNELPNLLKTGLHPPCAPCPNSPCCVINPSQHITSGTKAKTKSRYISTSENINVVAWYASNSSGNPKEKSATFVVLDLKDLDSENIINTCYLDTLGNTAKNMAKSSCEVLIKDHIPVKNIKQIFRVREIPIGIFRHLPEKYQKNNMEYFKISCCFQKKIKYLLTMKIYDTTHTILFDIVNGIFPNDYLPNLSSLKKSSLKKSSLKKSSLKSSLKKSSLKSSLKKSSLKSFLKSSLKSSLKNSSYFPFTKKRKLSFLQNH